ncbi:MAG: hypothetical protein JXA39_06120 [Bacteroidales bacterium]|nr:hypothetical protein [Bacteroidales bacterium]
MKTSRAIAIIFLVVILIPVSGFVSWYFKKGKELEIFFVNKSILNFKGTENKSFNWILNNQKILRPGKFPYDLKIQYFGTHIDGENNRIIYPRLSDLDRLVEKTDLVYYADISGIPASELKMSEPPEQDKLLYGGFNNTDYFLSRKAFDKGTKYIAECNFFGVPTDPLMRFNIEQLTDIYWLGWIGKYVLDLSAVSEDDICYNYREIYHSRTGQTWNFSGPGLILIDRLNDRVIVFREGHEINSLQGFIHAHDEAILRFNLPELTCFSGWFSLLHPGKNKTLCTFDFRPSEIGRAILKENGLPDTFPALIERNNHFYLLAGDFGKSEVRLCFSRIYGINHIIDAAKRKRFDRASNFFYTFYKPLITGILEETLGESAGKQEK